MADSVTVANLPATGFDLYGAYVDGAYANYAAAEARFPGKVVPIAVLSSTDNGIVGDCEPGAIWPPQKAVDWITMRRADGVDPSLYCSYGVWTNVQIAFNNVGVRWPHFWIADYPGIGPLLYPGTVAHQWVDWGPYDESVVADYWPGVDPAPGPNLKGDDMIASTPKGDGYWVLKPDGSIYAYGGAQYFGGANTAPLPPGVSATGITAHPTSQGYWIVSSAGSVYAYGAAQFFGPK
jgi:hypothetical protein